MPTLEDVEIVSRCIVERLNRTTGPTMFILPMRGWSTYDQSEALATRERGWARGNGDGPVWEPDPAHPEWSRRAGVMLGILRDGFDPSNQNLDLLATDHHILDPEFGDLVNRVMDEMLDHKWAKGVHRDFSIHALV